MVRAFVLQEASLEKNLSILQSWRVFLQETLLLLLHFAFVVQPSEVVASGVVASALWLVFPVSRHLPVS